MKEYKVLWFDDEHEALPAVHIEAAENNINLNAFDNAQEGLEELKSNYFQYDAVIVDGEFYLKKGDSQDQANSTAFGEVAKTLTALKEQNHVLPWFILSGRRRFVEEKNELVTIFADRDFGDGRVYDKNELEEFSLWDDIKQACDKRPYTRLKHKYSAPFEIFRNGYLGSSTEKYLLELLKELEDNKVTEANLNPFNRIRQIFENLLRVSYERDLIPEEIRGSKGELTKSVNFLCNSLPEFKLLTTYFHPTICNIFPQVLQLTQDASHDTATMPLKVNDYLKTSKGFLSHAVVYYLLDILIAFNDLFLRQERQELQFSLWEKIMINNLFEGPLQQDGVGNYHCGQYKLSYKTVHGVYDLGSILRITSGDDNIHSQTKDRYPLYARSFEAI